MGKYIVTANKLNKRKVIPANLPDASSIAGIVFKDFIFEGEEVVIVPNPALGKWYQDRDNFFYWGGALTEMNTETVVQPVTRTAGGFTLQQVKAATGSSTVNAQKFLQVINDTCDRFHINTAARGLCFLAQLGHESGGLFFTEELASGRAYEGRRDLGNTQTGDGVRFKGRGLIQITGRGHYGELTREFGSSFLDQPELLGGKNASHCTDIQIRNAALSAGWFWNTHKLNDLADKMDLQSPIAEGNNLHFFKKITEAINGGRNGLQDRVSRLIAGAPFFR